MIGRKNNIENEKYIMCMNPSKGSHIIEYAHVEVEDNQIEYNQQAFDYIPSLDEIKKIINDYYNQKCDDEILKGLKFDEKQVWLSQENQFNYKSAFDFAIQTEGSNLPVKFKLGTDSQPEYKTFNTVEELQEFITIVLNHVNNTLSKYWNIKDSIDWNKYTL